MPIAIPVCLGLLACLFASRALKFKRLAATWERSSAGFEESASCLREAGKIHRQGYQILANKAAAWKSRCEDADAEVVELRSQLAEQVRRNGRCLALADEATAKAEAFAAELDRFRVKLRAGP